VRRSLLFQKNLAQAVAGRSSSESAAGTYHGYGWGPYRYADDEDWDAIDRDDNDFTITRIEGSTGGSGGHEERKLTVACQAHRDSRRLTQPPARHQHHTRTRLFRYSSPTAHQLPVKSKLPPHPDVSKANSRWTKEAEEWRQKRQKLLTYQASRSPSITPSKESPLVEIEMAITSKSREAGKESADVSKLVLSQRRSLTYPLILPQQAKIPLHPDVMRANAQWLSELEEWRQQRVDILTKIYQREKEEGEGKERLVVKPLKSCIKPIDPSTILIRPGTWRGVGRGGVRADRAGKWDSWFR